MSQEELLSLQERAASHPYNEAALLRRINEIKAALGISAENTAADHDGIETAMHPQSRSRKTTKPAAE